MALIDSDGKIYSPGMKLNESKFKAGDKVVCVYAIDSLQNGQHYTVSHYKNSAYQDLIGIKELDNIEFFISRFELVQEPEMKQTFDMHTQPWYIRVEDEEQFNLANEWLKENFGSSLDMAYFEDVKYLTNTCGTEVEEVVMYGLKTYLDRPEVKLNFKTVISSVEWPSVEVCETEQQKRIRELKETIDNASKQLEELMKETE